MHAGPRRADLGGGLEFKALSIPTTEKDMGWILSRGTLPAAGHSLAVAAAAALYTYALLCSLLPAVYA